MVADSGLLISADSHVIEPSDLWETRLPASFRNRAPHFPKQTGFQIHQGGWDPVARVKEMAQDGVSGEVLYPSLTMDLFGLTDPALQEACFRVFNDWLIDYCKSSPERLFGVGTISTFDIDNAIREMERCKKAGMRGVMVWQVPPEKYSFATNHYERFWAAAQDMELPVSLHILTGEPYPPGRHDAAPKNDVESVSLRVNQKLLYNSESLSNIVISGVLERFPRLKIVLVETEVSWLPFVVSQWDKFCGRKMYKDPAIKLAPSEYFNRQVFATFFNDPPIRSLLRDWGHDNCMWSNDFPHYNSTWPKSREVIARDLGDLPARARAKLTHETVAKLYNLPVIAPLALA